MKTLLFVIAASLALVWSAANAEAAYLYAAEDDNTTYFAPAGEKTDYSSNEPWVWHKANEGYTTTTGREFADSNRIMAVNVPVPANTGTAAIEHSDTVFMIPTMPCFDKVSNVCQMKLYEPF